MGEPLDHDRNNDVSGSLHSPSMDKQDSNSKVKNVPEAELHNHKYVVVALIWGRTMKVDPLLPAVGFPLLGSERERERGAQTIQLKGH